MLSSAAPPLAIPRSASASAGAWWVSSPTTAKAQALSAGALAFATLSGSGHKPVLEPTVPLERR